MCAWCNNPQWIERGGDVSLHETKICQHGRTYDTGIYLSEYAVACLYPCPSPCCWRVEQEHTQWCLTHAHAHAGRLACRAWCGILERVIVLRDTKFKAALALHSHCANNEGLPMSNEVLPYTDHWSLLMWMLITLQRNHISSLSCIVLSCPMLSYICPILSYVSFGYSWSL